MGDSPPFYIVGLTGGIASGKSTVAQMFEELGVAVIDADVIARQVVAPGEPALDEIRRAFGDEVFDEDGHLDRAALGERVFGDDEARAKLEAITHPRIAQKMQERAAALRDEGHRWVIYDAALIVENELYRWLDALIVVAADPEVQRERLEERDDLSEDDIDERLEAQLPLERKLAVADYVIDNNGTLDQTRRQVERVHRQIERGVSSQQGPRPADPRKST